MNQRAVWGTIKKETLTDTLGTESRTARSGCDTGDTLQDHLWMWGHDSGEFDGPDLKYNIPLSPPIRMADGIHYLDIPNVCVIRYGIGNNEYNKQFQNVKRVTWTISMGAENSYQTLKPYVFGLRDIMPNLTGYYLDDFFRFHNTGANYLSETEPAPAVLSVDELKQLYEETLAYKRRLNLGIVLYTHLLCPGIKPYMNYVDTVSLWTWSGADIQKVEENFNQYRSLVPDKPTLLGIYMWDFGGKKELDMPFMVKQLDYALRLYKEGQIDGMIFHCTPLCNKNLPAVEYAKAWIAEHGREKRQCK